MSKRPPVRAVAQSGGALSSRQTLERLGVRLGARGLSPVVSAGRTRDAQLEAIVPGKVVETPHGPCFLVESRYRLDHSHGQHRLSTLPPEAHPSPLLAQLGGDERVVANGFASAIFFDIETTGLGIGAGMYAFLVGFGTYEGDEFCVRQYFMRDYAEEEALLSLLRQQMQDYEWWVSFNGRSFDLPVLQTRFTCARQEMPLAQAPHLDLLYPSRRLWRRRLASCALSSLEAGVLGVARESDAPGWLIPSLYFDYVRYGYAEPLRQVFLHNAMDILSLVVLAAKANTLLQEPFCAPAEHAVDLYSLGLVLETLGQPDAACRVYQQALQDPLPSELEIETLHRLASLCKKTGRIEDAVRIWHVLRGRGFAPAHVALAKHYEHVQRDCFSSAALVREALALEHLPLAGACSAPELTRRLTRLRKKLGEGGLPMPHIDSYSFGRITIDRKTYTSDLIILPAVVRPGWWRHEGHTLRADDLSEVVQAAPAVLVIGTGNVGLMQVPEETLKHLDSHGIRTVVERTALACQRYNELAKTENVAAALHLTC